MKRAMTRRRFLRDGTATACALASAGSFGQIAKAVGPSVTAPVLSPRRAATFVAIVEALDGPVPGVDAAGAPQALALLEARYRAEAPDLRRNIDLVLDAIDPVGKPGAFAQLTRVDRRASLHEGWIGRGSKPIRPGDAESVSRSALFRSAVQLAIQSSNVEQGAVG
jgi:hypothetical protein